MLARVEIQGFKCLRDIRVELGPFNVLIGPNDSGKSSFLQALGVQHRAASGVDASLQRISEPFMLEPMAVARPSPLGTGVLAKLIETRGQGSVAHLARAALGNRKLYDAIQKGMQEMSGGRVEEVVVGEHTEAGYPLSFRMYDGTVVPAREMARGLLVFFAFLCLVHRDDLPDVLLVEEPENGVHPLRVYEIVQLLRGLTERGVQILMTTCSPDLLSACKPEEVLVFRRPGRDASTEIHRLPADFERRAVCSTVGEVWASTGEEGLLDILPRIEPPVEAEG